MQKSAKNDKLGCICKQSEQLHKSSSEEQKERKEQEEKRAKLHKLDCLGFCINSQQP